MIYDYIDAYLQSERDAEKDRLLLKKCNQQFDEIQTLFEINKLYNLHSSRTAKRVIASVYGSEGILNIFSKNNAAAGTNAGTSGGSDPIGEASKTAGTPDYNGSNGTNPPSKSGKPAKTALLNRVEQWFKATAGWATMFFNRLIHNGAITKSKAQQLLGNIESAKTAVGKFEIKEKEFNNLIDFITNSANLVKAVQSAADSAALKEVENNATATDDTTTEKEGLEAASTVLNSVINAVDKLNSTYDSINEGYKNIGEAIKKSNDPAAIQLGQAKQNLINNIYSKKLERFISIANTIITNINSAWQKPNNNNTVNNTVNDTTSTPTT